MCTDLVVIRRVRLPGGGVAEIFGVCSECGHGRFNKNGNVRKTQKKPKRPNYECKACGRQSTLDPDNRTIPAVVKEIIDKLFAEGLQVSLVHRATGVSRSWLYSRHKKLTAREQP